MEPALATAEEKGAWAAEQVRAVAAEHGVVAAAEEKGAGAEEVRSRCWPWLRSTA